MRDVYSTLFLSGHATAVCYSGHSARCSGIKHAARLWRPTTYLNDIAMFPLSRFIPALLLFSAALFSLSAHADNPASESPRYNLISLQAHAQRDVVHDLMRVTLYSEAQGADPAKLAAQTTRTLNAATEQARQVAGVVIQTGSRTSIPVRDKDGKRIIAWRERAELHLESADFAALATLVSELLGELKMADRYFMISKTRRKTHEDRLLQEAIAAFGERARLAAQALGGKGYRLVSLSLDSSGFSAVRPQRLAASMMASASAYITNDAQQIEAGTSEVRMTAVGVIEVQM